jgi:hypothetical protein
MDVYIKQNMRDESEEQGSIKKKPLNRIGHRTGEAAGFVLSITSLSC